MPQKGQKAITINDETYKLLENFARAKEMSVAGVVSWCAKEINNIDATEILNEENLKEALVQSIATYESYEEFLENMKGERFKGVIGRIEFVNTNWFKSMLSEGSAKQLNFYDCMIELNNIAFEVKADKAKLHRMLGRLAPQGLEASRIIPKPAPMQVVKTGPRSTDMDIIFFISHLEVYYGKDFDKFKEVIEKFDEIMSVTFPLHTTIELIYKIQKNMMKLKAVLLDGIDEKTRIKYGMI